VSRLSDEFKKRYNRDTTIEVLNSEKDITSLKFKSDKGKEYIITEYRVLGATDYVTVEFGDKKHRYARYIDAEVFIADLIGDEEEKG